MARIVLDDSEYRPESTIVRNGDLEVRVPAFPEPCDYVRVVRRLSATTHDELAYWNSEEWQADPDLSCIGAIAGAIKEVTDGKWRV